MAANETILEMPDTRTRNWSIGWLVFWIALLWLGAGFPPANLLAFTFPIVCLLYLARARFKPLALYVLFSPFAISALQGAMDYARGTARLQCNGLPDLEFWNVDPELRCCRMTHG